MRLFAVLCPILAVSALMSFASQGVEAQAQAPRQGPKPAAIGQDYMVSSSHPLVNEAMVDVLEKGGNAVDAMITAVLLQPVVEPHMSTLAGGVGGLIYLADAHELVYLDAELNLTGAPGGAGITSGGRIGVPGTVRGLGEAAERYGTLSWEEYVAPAIRVAEEGFLMYPYLYYYIMEGRERLAAHRVSRARFLPDGVPPAVGEVFRQPELAETLRTLAREGPEWFYTGEWARQFVEKVNETGGRITASELEEYQVRWVEPVEFRYHGHRIVAAPPASTAGVFIGMILNILENFDLPALGHYTESAEAIRVIRHAYDVAQGHSSRYIGDPRSVENPVGPLLSKEYAGWVAGILNESRSRVDPVDRREAVADFGAHASSSPGGNAVVDTDTNHLVIVDPQGNWVSMTHTVYGSTFATGLTVGGVGVNSGNGFPGAREGEGRRVITPFPATMILDDGGRPWAALGSPGMSSRAVAMTLINLLGYGMDLHSAVHAPRFQGYGPGEAVRAESRFNEEVLKSLSAWGISYALVGGFDQSMGSMHAVMRDAETGRLIGVADARRTGFASGR